MFKATILLALSLFSGALHAAPLPLKVDGLQVEDSSGKVVPLHGVDVCSMEWTAQGDHVLQSINVVTEQWHANIIRLPLCQDRWFGKTADSAGPQMEAYHQLVDSAVTEAAEHGAYIVLDLHWNDMNDWGQNIGQHDLPDDNSIQFWQAVGKRYANRPNVLFDVYNEPHDIPWDVWKNGGQVTEGGHTYHSPGMQACLDAIRDSGANNVVIVGGLGYASQLDMPDADLLDNRHGQGIIYVNHFYPGWETVDSWQKRMDAARHRFPIIVSEFGPGQPYGSDAHQVSRVLNYLQSNNMNWCAWCVHPQAGPCLIKDWTYAVTPGFGLLVKEALGGKVVPLQLRETSSPDVTIYDDKFGDSWQSWSSADVDSSSTEQVHAGNKSIRVKASQGQNLQIGVCPFDARRFTSIDFWLYAPADFSAVVRASLMDTAQPPYTLEAPPPNTWTHYTIRLSKLGVEDSEYVKSFAFDITSPGSTLFYVDDAKLIGAR